MSVQLPIFVKFPIPYVSIFQSLNECELRVRTEHGEGDGLGARQKGCHLGQGCEGVELQDGLHPPIMSDRSPASDSLHVRNTPAVQTHFILEETT